MAAGRTYTPIATTTLSSAQTTVTFSSISGSYTDLILVWTGTATAGAEARLRFNGDTGTNYSHRNLAGDGTSALSSGGATQSVMFLTTYGTPSTTPGNFIAHIMNYSNTTTYKTVLARGNRITSGFGPDATVGLWRNTAAVTQIDLTVSNTTWAAGSTFTLYGIAAA